MRQLKVFVYTTWWMVILLTLTDALGFGVVRQEDLTVDEYNVMRFAVMLLWGLGAGAVAVIIMHLTEELKED